MIGMGGSTKLNMAQEKEMYCDWATFYIHHHQLNIQGVFPNNMAQPKPTDPLGKT